MPASKRKSPKGKRPSSLVGKLSARKAARVKGGNVSLSPSQQAKAKSNVQSTWDKTADALVRNIKG
jgi:hypothetical protein